MQYSVPAELYHFPSFTRYEHCVGVTLLLRKLGATLEEQTAGLLHDVSHTAFSHVIDWVFEDRGEEDFHDKKLEVFVRDSEIPQILGRHDIDVRNVIDTKRHGLLVYEGRVVFSSRAAAKAFAMNLLKCQAEHWGGAESIVRYHLFAEALRTALGEGVVTMEDFYQDDYFVMKKIRESRNPRIEKALKTLAGGLRFSQAASNPQLMLKRKFRYVDPESVENGNAYRLSEEDGEFRIVLEEQRRANAKGIRVDVLH